MIETSAKLKRATFNWFDYLYMFVIVIYMGMATDETSRMTGNFTGNPVPFLIPIILTLCVWIKYRISIANVNLWLVIGAYLVWMVLSIIKYGKFDSGEFSYHFFFVYAIFVAYIQVQAYGRKFFSLYERITVWFAKIAIFMFAAGLLLPPVREIYSLFPETYAGNIILYIFNWNKKAGTGESLRNAGMAWEAGRYAIMVVLAVFCNLSRKGIKFKGNPNVIWLLIALASTLSTTGYVACLALYFVFLLKKTDTKSLAILIFVALPTTWGISQLDFIGEKITTKLEAANDVSRLDGSFEWGSQTYTTGEYRGSIDRFDAIPFEWMNLMNDPLLGYGRNFRNSYFYNHISSNYVLANGLMKIPATFGIFYGLFWFVILYISSAKIASQFKHGKKWALFIAMCLCAVSYQVLGIPIFTAFWLYGLFYNEQRKEHKRIFRHEMSN